MVKGILELILNIIQDLDDFFLVEYWNISLDGFWLGHLAAQNSCALWWTPKVKVSPKNKYGDRISGADIECNTRSCTLWWTPKVKMFSQNRIWWQEFWGWYWIQYNTLMTFFLIEYLEYVLRWFLDRSFSCTKFLHLLVDSQSGNVLPKPFENTPTPGH